MTWYLFLDDERTHTLYEYDPRDVLTSLDCSNAILLIEELGLPAVISFDHDLGDVPNAMTLMKYLVDGHLDGHFDLNTIDRIIIHSRNPEGSKNLQGLWDGFATSELDSGVRAEMRPRKTLTT